MLLKEGGIPPPPPSLWKIKLRLGVLYRGREDENKRDGVKLRIYVYIFTARGTYSELAVYPPLLNIISYIYYLFLFQSHRQTHTHTHTHT